MLNSDLEETEWDMLLFKNLDTGNPVEIRNLNTMLGNYGNVRMGMLHQIQYYSVNTVSWETGLLDLLCGIHGC